MQANCFSCTGKTKMIILQNGGHLCVSFEKTHSIYQFSFQYGILCGLRNSYQINYLLFTLRNALPILGRSHECAGVLLIFRSVDENSFFGHYLSLIIYFTKSNLDFA